MEAFSLIINTYCSCLRRHRVTSRPTNQTNENLIILNDIDTFIVIRLSVSESNGMVLALNIISVASTMYTHVSFNITERISDTEEISISVAGTISDKSCY